MEINLSKRPFEAQIWELIDVKFRGQDYQGEVFIHTVDGEEELVIEVSIFEHGMDEDLLNDLVDEISRSFRSYSFERKFC